MIGDMKLGALIGIMCLAVTILVALLALLGLCIVNCKEEGSGATAGAGAGAAAGASMVGVEIVKSRSSSRLEEMQGSTRHWR